MHQQQEGRDDVFQSAQHETDRQLILAAAPTSAALDGGEEIWKRNPYPATNPKHNEFRRQVRTQTIDRMGPRAAKSMRLSDFVADEYRSELASSAEHRHKQQYIAVNGGGSESAGGGVVVPYRSASTASSSISLAPAASKLRGFREPLPPRVQSRPVTEFSTTTTKDRESMPATKGCRISCAVTLHGSKSVWVALSDGTVRIHERQPHPPHRPVTSFKDTDNKPGVRSIDVRQQFLDDERASRRTQLAGKECGVMGTEEQCAHGSWASKRLHRSIDHLTVKSSSEATDSHDAPRLLATCMEVLGQRYVALGISTGDIHVWDALTGEGVVMMHTTTTTTPTATQPSAAAHAVHLAFLSSRQKDLPFPEPQAENDPMDEGDDRRSQLSLTQAPPKSVADASQEREEFFFSIVFSDGTVAVACFDEGMGITCNPPPCASSSSSAAGTSTTITATLSLVCLRPRLIKSSFHRNAIGISTDCASMYIADAEGTMYMIDVDDLQVSAKWELRTICAFQQQDSGSKQQLPSHAMSRGNRGVTAALNASAANAAVVAASLPQSTPFSWTSPDCPPIATSLDCLDSLIAIGFESGEVILLERRKRAQTRSTLAFVHGLRLSSTSTDAGINANTSKQSNGTKAVGALKIAAWTNEVWVATRSKEMYVVSLDPHLGYSLVNKISLPASAADDVTPPPPSDTTGAVAGCCTDTLSTTINLSLHCHLDAMEVWSAGADDANYTWMTDLSRTREEVHQNIQLLHARGFTDESSLVQWRDATSKKEKATSAALDGAVGDLLMTAQHALYRRYYWMWRHFRLEHQLRKKQPTLGSILGRIMLTTLGRSYFTTWCSYRNRHRTWKREGHVAATLECVKRRQLQQGAMIVWERFAAMRKRLRQGETASTLLAKQTQRRHMCTSFMRWVSFTRRQHIQRRWTAFAVTQSKTLLVSLQRRCFGNWMLYRQQRYECRQREACAEGLIPHSQKSLLACSWTTWLALCALRRQQRVLSHWSNSVDASASEVTAGKAYQAWLMLVHERREARATAKLDQYTQKEKNLEQSIAIAAPRLQRLRKLVALKQRVSSLKERADELRTIEESLEDRVISLRVSTIPPDVRRMFSSASIIIRHGEERSNNGSTVGGTMSGITDSPDRMAGGAAIDNEDSSSPKEGAQDTATGGSGGDVTELISSAVWASFPSAMERLKRRVIDLAWDVPLIVSTVDRVRGSQLKSFHHAVLGAEKIIRGMFASHVTTTTTTTATGSGSTVTNEFTREESARQAMNASPLRPWVPETVTESALRKAVIRLVEEDPNAAHTLQNTIKTLIIAYDCMPPKEKRNDVDARDSSAVVHHEELLTIVADALARSLAMRREQQQQQRVV